MVKKLILPVILALFLCSCTIGPKIPPVKITPSPSPTQGGDTTHEEIQLKASDFFPLTLDVHKIYRGSGNEFAGFETYVEYVRGNLIQLRSINAGTNSVKVYDVSNGALKLVYTEGEIYYRYDFTSCRGDEEVLIKEPIKAGTEWKLKDGAKRSITAVNKSIQTPSGSYKALEITTIEPDSTTLEYYVKDLGLVKRIFSAKDSGASISSELEKIEKDVPFKHTVRFYFPQFVKDRTVYMDRIVEINTNQDMKYKFQKELKTIPQDNTLSRTLTTNVQVLGAVVDRKSGITTVNFSPELISEMNAGSGYESMIINCIVNTFGRYYQTDKVIITVNGKPYSSGHILLKPGEYFKVDTKNTVKYQ
jgi:Sporulation and spore germination.